MSIGSRKRIRTGRVAPLDLPPGSWERFRGRLREVNVLGRLLLCAVAAIAIWATNYGWSPPFNYREGEVPDRDIAASVAFEKPDPVATKQAQLNAESHAHFVYKQDAAPLVQLRAKLQNAVVAIASAPSLAAGGAETWKQFEPPASTAVPNGERREEEFAHFRAAVADKDAQAKFEQAVEVAFAPFEQHGLLDKLPDLPEQGNQIDIVVTHGDRKEDHQHVKVSDVLLGSVTRDESELRKRLETGGLGDKKIADHVFYWLRPRLKPTLVLDEGATQEERLKARRGVQEAYQNYPKGSILAVADKPLGPPEIELLRLEHQALLANLRPSEILFRTVGMLILLTALFTLMGHYLVRFEPRLIRSVWRFSSTLALAVLAIAMGRWVSGTEDLHGAEVMWLLLFGMTYAIAYRRELALMLTLACAAVLVMASGRDLGDFIIMSGVAATAILQIDRIRTRTKLIRVGCVAGAVAFVLTVAAGLTEGGPLDRFLLLEGARHALWSLAAGFLMTGLLPFVEKAFGVVTELKLLELSDISHPLLQELVRRAPGTYNHSINVAAIAEAAAESIGGQGLLVRVGAYFHDIGKMLKPGYFVENQGMGGNRHDALAPAMSTLIIIAHIKDGADLARQHHLPHPIIDFIEQHHGTTLVEYFYRRASEQRDPEGATVEERSFRYPGPKPQTKEAAVLMISDAVESASRALVEPTPARLEGLVEQIAQNRLLDGQFDDCDLTLEELRTVEDSLIKSLTAVYHCRVKYPDHQQSA